MKKQLQKGFTLIELMIVIAIIGILASIALPAYQDYIARAQTSEGLMLLTAAKKDVNVNFIDPLGTFPTTTTILQTNLGSKIQGNYGAITVANPNGSNGDLVFTFSSGSSFVINKNITFSHSASGGISTWTCTSNLLPQHKPKGC